MKQIQALATENLDIRQTKHPELPRDLKKKQTGSPTRRTQIGNAIACPLAIYAPNIFGAGGGDAVATFPCPAKTKRILHFISLTCETPEAFREVV